jgi:hypothetical protein
MYKNETSCTAIGILEHYFILVSFVAMSVISHHSCVVFSKNLISARRSEGENCDTFIKYTAVVWTLPAAIVAVCIALDKTEVFPINYGTICFLATEHSKIYLFILPIGLSLLFNLSIYIRTAIFLVKQQESTGELHQNRKQNLKICIKLSTLTGFPWIFGFLHAGLGNIVAFEYFFVIFICLQGLYVAVAFLWNTRVHKLYKNRFNNGDRQNNKLTMYHQCRLKLTLSQHHFRTLLLEIIVSREVYRELKASFHSGKLSVDWNGQEKFSLCN